MITKRVIHMVVVKIGDLIELNGWNGDTFFGIVSHKDKEGINVIFHDGDSQWYYNEDLEEERMYILEVS